jgi:hypothetical protein
MSKQTDAGGPSHSGHMTHCFDGDPDGLASSEATRQASAVAEAQVCFLRILARLVVASFRHESSADPRP